jgi:hypothetical protein
VRTISTCAPEPVTVSAAHENNPPLEDDRCPDRSSQFSRNGLFPKRMSPKNWQPPATYALMSAARRSDTRKDQPT